MGLGCFKLDLNEFVSGAPPNINEGPASKFVDGRAFDLGPKKGAHTESGVCFCIFKFLGGGVSSASKFRLFLAWPALLPTPKIVLSEINFLQLHTHTHTHTG